MPKQESAPSISSAPCALKESSAESLAKPSAHIYLMVVGIVGLWLGFPNDFVHLPPLALLYVAVLARLGSEAQKPLEALRLGWITGLFGSAAAMYWLTIPIHTVGGLPWALAVPCALAMGAYVGLYGALFSWASFKLTRALPNAPLRRVIALACAWYGLELLRNVAFTGFPWLTLSAAFAPYPFFIQGAQVIGAYALSGVFTAITLCILHICTSLQKHRLQQAYGTLAMGLILMISLTAYGYNSLFQAPPPQQDKAFPVIMVEGNIDQNIKWEKTLQQATLNTYIRLSSEAVHALRQNQPKAQPLLIWPETAMPFFLERHAVFGRQLLNFIREAQSPLLVGAPAAHVDKTGQNRPFNRAYSIGAEAQLLGYYDKMHLVPFGEYVPPWLQLHFLEGLLQSIGAFSAGSEEKPLQSLAFMSPEHKVTLALGVLICYEGIFPELAQERVSNGANVLVNISNDGWFGRSPAPTQHLHLSLLRAVEQGRWLIRGTNTGISTIVDPRGRLHVHAPQFTAQSLLGTAYSQEETTLFNALFYYIPWAVLVLFVLCIGSYRWKK